MSQRARREAGRWEQRLSRFILAFGRVDRVDGRLRPRGILRIFLLAERLIERWHPLRSVRPGGLVRYEVVRLRRPALPLPDQPPVRRGERVVNLHFDNHTIAALAAEAPDAQALTWRLARASTRDLRLFADLVRAGTFPPDVRTAWTESLFFPVLGRYGFMTRPAPRTLRAPFARLFLLAMLMSYGGPDLAPGADRQLYRQLGEAWMGLDALQQRYRPAGPGPADAPSAHAAHAPDEDAAQAGAGGAAQE